ncbi:MAG: hypothetical protein GXC72_10360 [Chitinophagaceae bacterium]|jgi:FKBP-type peptidyl-prolyl cis-trans isomerase|nr:hypothetical protein [Chitinophagaceae bacterium]
MKQTVLVVAALMSLLFLSCGKTESGCQPKTPASEKAEMVAYCNSNGINYTEHASGILYEIILPGSGVTPSSTNTISAVYTCKLLNNTLVDSNANPTDFYLGGNLIDGWKIAIPLIKKGGRIKIVVPSALAYSCTGRGSVPPNSPLFFDITLNDVK